MAVRFDQSLEVFVQGLEKALPANVLDGAVFVRDGVGQLSVALPIPSADGQLEKLARHLKGELGGYARDSLIRCEDTRSGAMLLKSKDGAQTVEAAGRRVSLIDRRIVGGDWIRLLPPNDTKAKRIAFTSIKGGVGRSTALCVAAIHLSLKGLRVLAIDLDLEAPGIGTMLLNDDELPMFGVVDYLVENNLSGIDDEFLTNLVANSRLGAAGGRVGVVPAYGTVTLNAPSNALAKLSRAYVEDVVDGHSLSIGTQLREMVDRLSSTNEFDVVLIDARAGLHELSASVFTSIGAEVLMFGLAQPQTYHGYDLLLAHLRASFGEDGAWQDRMRFVHSRAEGTEADIAEASQKMSALLSPVVPPAGSVPNNDVPTLTADDFELVWDDEVVPLVDDISDYEDVVVIREDPAFHQFDPRANPLILSEESYRATYSELLATIDALADVVVDDE